MNTYIKKSLCIVITMILCLQLCAFILPDPGFAIDTEKNHVYSYLTLKELLEAFDRNEIAAQDKYNDQYFLLTGEFEQLKPNDNGFTLMIGNGNFRSIICQIKKGTNINAEAYSFQDQAAVYGKCSISAVFHTIRFTDVEKIGPVPSVRSADCYFTLDNTSLDRSAALQRSLNDGKIKYYIPSYWENIEADIRESDLGSIEGYQYVLNDTQGSKNSVPESLFVCYFSKDQLVDRQEIEFTNRKKIEKLIINNINGNSNAITSGFRTTYYGAAYDYFLCRYTDPFNFDGYRTEYVFQTYKNEGLIMYMYLYREPKHLSDVMLVTRLLEAH